MSVDIKDARAYFKKQAEDAAVKKETSGGLLQQVEIAQVTGDPRLDKMLRTIAAKMEEVSKLSQQFANDAMRCVNQDQLRQKQMEYMATQGALKILMEVAQIPAQIIAEETGNGLTN